MEFKSRRSPVYSTNGMVASSQPLASAAGLDILRRGGNAMDACVAMAACLAVTEPCSTGIGGDAFFLFYSAADKKVYSCNGSGYSPEGLTLDLCLNTKKFTKAIPYQDGCSVSVPGAVDCWLRGLERFGSQNISRIDILKYAVDLARFGFPVAPVTSHHWRAEASKLKQVSPSTCYSLLINGEGPKEGELFKNEYLADVLEQIGLRGRTAFYEGEVAERIVDAVQKAGGCLSMNDLKQYEARFEDPIYTEFMGSYVYECSPNGQGLIALLALGIIMKYSERNNIDLKAINDEKRISIIVESLKIAFRVGMESIYDNPSAEYWQNNFLSNDYLEKLSCFMFTEYSASKIKETVNFGTDTVYECAADKYGNCCSFINSNYLGFGSCIIPEKCGFSLQNRASNFSLKKGHANVVAPRKRPYHTIIPGMLVNKDFVMPFGVMGGFMQPQGHVQVLWNMLINGMNSQQALDLPRVYLHPIMNVEEQKWKLSLEEGIAEERSDELKQVCNLDKVDLVSGHERALFGRGQIIIAKNNGVFCAGSDPRSDGLAIGF